MPPYPLTHSGPCIVAGSAWCLGHDLEKARAVLGDVPVIAVNGASREVRAVALFSQHYERLLSSRWIHHQQRRFGDDFTVHSVGDHGPEYVHHWWPIRRAGGSAWGARKVAALIGFDPVVLCGCPMQTGPYVAGHSIGGLMQREEVVSELRRQIKADRAWHEGCLSISGWTRDLLGTPKI